jgi:hypothetical protein
LCGTPWNYGGSSDEIFSDGRRYLVSIASRQAEAGIRSSGPVFQQFDDGRSEYPRALPHWNGTGPTTACSHESQLVLQAPGQHDRLRIDAEQDTKEVVVADKQPA